MSETPETGYSTASFQIKPDLENKFRPRLLYELLHSCLIEELSEYEYDPATVETKTLGLTEIIRNKVL